MPTLYAYKVLISSECDHYSDYFEKALNDMGYRLLFTQKGGGRLDGLLIGYKDTLFEVKSVVILDFDKISEDSNAKKGYLCPVAEMIHKETRYLFILACVHLHYDPILSYMQGSYLLSEV